MTITTVTLKLFGKRETLFQVRKNGEVVHVAETREEAQAYIDAQA